MITKKEDVAVQAKFTPERLAKIDAAPASIRSGNVRTLEHLDERIAEARAEALDDNSPLG